MMRQTPLQVHRYRKGFTLVELLIGMALTLFIMGLFTTLFMAATTSVNAMRGITSIDQATRSAASAIRRDLQDAYLENNGAKIPLNEVFTGTEKIPTGGYFTYEENSTATRQGVDEWGIPVEVDTDDVLAMTVRRRGDSPEEMFWANVPAGSVLDDIAYSATRFDTAGNGQFSSPYAEIVLFLRPQGEQYSEARVRGNNGALAKATSKPTETVSPNRPALFQLVRIVRVVVPDDVGVALDAIGGAGPSATNYYLNYGVSGHASGGTVTFNRLSNLDRRQNRFGMNNSDTLDFPLSWSSATTCVNTGAPATLSVFDRTTLTNPQWIGRPYSLELNIAAIDPFATFATALADPNFNADADQDGMVGDSTGATATTASFNTPNANYRAGTAAYGFGEDVILRNVLSFDVKVYDDDPRVEPTLAWLNDTLSTVRINSNRRAAVNPRRGEAAFAAASADEQASEFIDLGIEGTVEPCVTVAGAPAGFAANLDDNYAVDNSPFGYSANSQTGGFPTRWRHRGRVLPTRTAYSPVRTYDTWSSEYEINPASTSGLPVRPVPYPKPLKAIQIKLRVLEPNSGVIRETTIVHRFR